MQLLFFVGWVVIVFVFAVFTPEADEISDFQTQIAGLLSAVLAVLFSLITNYNKIFRLREIAKARYSSIQISETKANKLVKQAVDVMNTYMQHETETHQNVANFRANTGIAQKSNYSNKSEVQGISRD